MARLADLRSTRQRRAIADLVEDVDVFTSAQAVHEMLVERGEYLGLSTVYRTLQVFADAGVVDWLRSPDGEVLYRKCGDHRHYHLVCRLCGHTVEMEGQKVEQLIRGSAADHGYANVDVSIEVFGLCAACS